MFSLIALVATFVVESNKKVSQSGIIPEGAHAEYVCTGRKGQMTAGQTATLTLSGWQDTEIQSVILSMHSNKAAGAGSLQMSVDGREVWTISDSGFDVWNGAYSSDYVDITHTFTPAVDCTGGSVVITIQASINSLYIEKYKIIYQKSAARPYSVDLQTETGTFATLTETQIGGGITLPAPPDTEGWKALGWAENAVEKTTVKPQIHTPNSIFRPRQNTTLWAVYSDNLQEPDLLQRVDCQSGYYAIAFPVVNAAYAGRVDNSTGTLPAIEVSLSTTDSLWYERKFDITSAMVYYIDFAADSTATITHVSSSESVGYKNNKLSATTSRWHYRPLADQTVAFFVPDPNSQLVSALWTSLDADRNWCGKLVRLNESTLVYQALLYEAPENESVTHYTSFPKRSDLTSPDTSEQPEKVIQIGIYELHIQGDKKRIYLHK